LADFPRQEVEFLLAIDGGGEAVEIVLPHLGRRIAGLVALRQARLVFAVHPPFVRQLLFAEASLIISKTRSL